MSGTLSASSAWRLSTADDAVELLSHVPNELKWPRIISLLPNAAGVGAFAENRSTMDLHRQESTPPGQRCIAG